MLELKAFGYALLIIVVLVVGLVIVSIRKGRQDAYKKMEKESQEAMKRVLESNDDITKLVQDMTDEELDKHI